MVEFQKGPAPGTACWKLCFRRIIQEMAPGVWSMGSVNAQGSTLETCLIAWAWMNNGCWEWKLKRGMRKSCKTMKIKQLLKWWWWCKTRGKMLLSFSAWWPARMTIALRQEGELVLVGGNVPFTSGHSKWRWVDPQCKGSALLITWYWNSGELSELTRKMGQQYLLH